jgi:predicted nucleic acid-binding protein
MNITAQNTNKCLLVDTNVVVNAAFIPNSFSDYCVRMALNAGYHLVVSDAIDAEIVKTVTSAASVHELQVRAMRSLRDFMRQALSDEIVVDSNISVPV